jgi:hypothetical protein
VKKIPTLYVRDPEDRRYVTDEVTPGCEWVLAGEGTATRKFDGTCVMVDESGQWWARREVKPGKAAPLGFVEVEHDETTGKTVGWEPIQNSPFHKFWDEAVDEADRADLWAGTYELVGPKINGNPEHEAGHVLIRHGWEPIRLLLPPSDLMDYCRAHGWEGVVWHHPDGRMAKLKVRDIRPAVTQ